MKIQYVANDGKTFEDKNECQRYESQIMCDTEFKGCLFYDHHKQKFPISNGTIENVWFVHFETLDQLKKFKELNDRVSISNNDFNDINENFSLDFYYSNGEFRQYNNEINKLFEQISELEKEKDKLFYNDL